MTLAERLAAIVQALPESGSVTLPVSELKHWLSENGNGASTSSATKPERPPERLLKAKEVAKLLGASPRYVYAQAARRESELGKLVKKLPGGAVRFSERALLRWMEIRG